MSERSFTPAVSSSGYHTPDNQTTRSSSPGSVSSFHTANPIDSERSSPRVHTDVEGWQTPQPEYLSSLEAPSLDGDNTPLVAEADRPHPYTSLPPPGTDETDEEATLRNNPSPPQDMEDSMTRGAEGEARNWIGQPKLIPADSDTIPPCPEKRPLPENSVRGASRNHRTDTGIRETTPLLHSDTSSTQSGERERDCCILL